MGLKSTSCFTPAIWWLLCELETCDVMDVYLRETADIHKNTLDSKGLMVLFRLLLGREVVSFVQVFPQTSYIPV